MYILVTPQFTNKWQNEYWGENHITTVIMYPPVFSEKDIEKSI